MSYNSPLRNDNLFANYLKEAANRHGGSQQRLTETQMNELRRAVNHLRENPTEMQRFMRLHEDDGGIGGIFKGILELPGKVIDGIGDLITNEDGSLNIPIIGGLAALLAWLLQNDSGGGQDGNPKGGRD